MIVDSSALLAILRGEPEADAFIDAIAAAANPTLSAATWLEAAIVVDSRRDPALSRDFDRLVAPLAIAPVTEAQARRARDAYRDFGKGSGHPAQLNFGDCFVFALAEESGAPVLFKGEDFKHAGLVAAV